MIEWLKGYLVFSKKERTGVIALLVLIFSIWLLPGLFGKPEQLQDELLLKADSARKTTGEADAGTNGGLVKTFRLFPFDPNLASNADWELLGVRPKTIATIRKYLDKGGKFRQPEDLLKIYGLRKDEVERLMPFVRIEQVVEQDRKQRAYRANNFRVQRGYETKAYPASYSSESKWKAGPSERRYQRPARRPVDINLADSMEFEALPGIGPKLAARIIRFREACGGFYSVKQVAEIYGISDTLFLSLQPLLLLQSSHVRKISINGWNVDSLAMHPYIQRHEAKAIVQYRHQHGRFQNLEDLSRVTILSTGWLEKISFYLDFD
jgi:DNA uptake protein ComE-like DNA-binding protein